MGVWVVVVDVLMALLGPHWIERRAFLRFKALTTICLGGEKGRRFIPLVVQSYIAHLSYTNTDTVTLRSRKITVACVELVM